MRSTPISVGDMSPKKSILDALPQIIGERITIYTILYMYIKYLMIQTSMWNPHFIDTRNLGEITKRVQEAMEEKNLNQCQLFFCSEKGLFLENPNSGWNCYFFFTKGFRSADFVCSVTLCFLPKVKKLNISDINRAINHPIIMFIESSFGIYLREGMSPKLSSLHQNIVAI